MLVRATVLGFLVLSLLAVPGAAEQGGIVRTERLGATVALDGNEGLVTAANAIIGAVRGHDRGPLPEARLRLRNLGAGQIAERTTSDGEGRFAFRSIETGTYVVELTDANDAVLVLSEAVTIGSGEIVQVLVQLSERRRSFGWWLGSTTASALSTAASLGVLTVAPGASASPVS